MIIKHYQDLISQISDIAHKEIGIADEGGLIIACSDAEKVGQEIPSVQEFIKSEDVLLLYEGFQYKKLYIRSKLGLIIYIKSEDVEEQKFLDLISFNISTLMEYYDIKYDKLSFIKKVVKGNLDTNEIYLFAKDFHILNTIPRVVLLIRTEEIKDIYVHEVIQSLFPDKNKDFVIVVNSEEILLIRELRTTEDMLGVEKIATSIFDTLQTEIMVACKIAIGTVVNSLENLKKSYEEAGISMEIGNIFHPESPIFRYDNLGIGRLIHQLPPNHCKLFLQELSKNSFLESLDTENQRTINAFFKNNLNVSETARKLYMHRNTLIYRLEKINRLTGLDIIRFDDAVTLKVALLVKKYLDSIKKEE